MKSWLRPCPRPKFSVTETAKTETAQTKSARPKSPVSTDNGKAAYDWIECLEKYGIGFNISLHV